MCLLLACLGHARADGHLPDTGSLLIAFGLVGVVCVRLAGRQRGFCFIGALLGVAQMLLHFGFGVAAAMTTAGHHHGAVLAPGAALGPVPALRDGLHAWTPQMAIGHALATLLAAACMAYGERVLWWLARLVAPRLTLPRPCPVAGPGGGAVHAGAAASLPARHGVLLARSVVRRGPPVFLAA